MNITLIAVGKLKERFWKDAVLEYSKRLKGYCKLRILEIPDRDAMRCGGNNGAINKESEDILKAVASCTDARSGKTQVILLAIKGNQFSSEDIAAHIQKQALHGTSDFVFIIGGSMGVSEEVIKRADTLMSFGKITFPHNLARVVLLEQIYRAFKIMRHEPYHK